MIKQQRLGVGPYTSQQVMERFLLQMNHSKTPFLPSFSLFAIQLPCMLKFLWTWMGGEGWDRTESSSQ